MRMTRQDRKDHLEKLLSMAALIDTRLNKERSRVVSCPICRDYHVIRVKYMLPIKDEKSNGMFYARRESLSRCFCSGAAACNRMDASMDSLAVIIDRTPKFVCCRCKKNIGVVDESKVLTMLSGRDREMEMVCVDCYNSKEFETKQAAMTKEYLELCGEIKPEKAKAVINTADKAKAISKAELLQRILNKNKQARG